jgi:hypothetical protein
MGGSVKYSILVFVASLLLAANPGTPQQDATGKPLRGWLSDEQCSRARATGGVFTSTNPDCARGCVAKGDKIVLILPDAKEIVAIENQDAAKEHVGDYVEVAGSFAQVNNKEGARVLRVDSLKMITKGVAMCGIPKKK